MTETATPTLDIVPVRVSSDFDDRPLGGFGNGEFFAVKDSHGSYVLLVPTTDPRSEGMWNGTTYARQAGLENAGDYRAWSVYDRYITVLETAPVETESARVVENASQLQRGDVFQIASTATQYVVTGDRSEDGNTLPIEWGRGTGDRLADWRGPSMPSVRVNLVPESAQSDWARERVAQLSPVPVTDESGESVPEESVTLTVSELNARLESAKRDGRNEANATFESWKESANATAIEYANDNSLCSEFDRCMRDIGMMDRDEWRESHKVEFEVEFTYSTTIDAADEDDAIELAQEEFEQWRGDWSARRA